MIVSREIHDLQPKVAVMCREFIHRCRQQRIDVLIYCTYRDEEAQTQLYEQGRISQGRIVTNAKAGQSYHNWRCAFDFVPMVHGKPAWNDAKLYEKCGQIAESVGLEWAGRWMRFREYPHCQYSAGITLKQFREGTADLTLLS